MPVEPGLIVYAGLACLATASERHRANARFVQSRPVPARIIGVVLLIISLAIAGAASGVAQGIVAWISQLSVAAIALVLVMSWKPRMAVFFAVPALLVSLAICHL